MRPSEPLLDDLADAILDGTAIDWASVESSVEGSDRALIENLRLIGTLADVHRVGASTLPTGSDDPQPLDQWGHLRVLERLGRGAFGEVYRAWDTRLDREVALKLLPAESARGEHSVSSIIHEGRLLARVRHSNVVMIYGAEQIGDRIGLWMEHVRGRTLEQSVKEGKIFGAAETVEIGLQLCRAVSAVHNAGLLHRDIKAHNVMRADDGRVVLMDFGAGRELADDESSDLAGTPLYLAPEALHGQPATVRSDVYSLGVLLYHLVTGSYPVHARTVREIRRAHESGERTALHTVRRDLSSKLASVIERAIDPDPDRRHESAEALMGDLSRLSAGAQLRRRLAIVAVVLALAGAGALWSALWTNEPPVIAVVPFKNLSAEPDSEYFVDGLTDEIIRNLSVIDGLAVRSRTSSFTFKNKPRNTREVGQLLEANLLVEGSVLRVGGKLRINAQLVRVADDTPLWSGRFDRDLKDVFVIQDEISRSIVNELRLTLGRGQRRYETNLEAYDLYLKARTLIDRRHPSNAKIAVGLFEQAIGRDPAFAPAYAGLANAYAFMSVNYAGISFEEANSRMRPVAVKAVQLDPLLAEAHAAMGWVYSREFNWANADESFRRAIELTPSLTQIYTSYSFSTLHPLAKLDEALRLLQLALRRDPLSLDVRREMAAIQFSAGQYQAAIDNLQRVRAVDPDFPFVDMYLGRALLFAGHVGEALPLLRKFGERSEHFLGHAYAMTGRRAEAEMLANKHAEYPFRQAVIYAGLGDKDRAFEALERMAVTEPHRLAMHWLEPEFAALRDDPRLLSLRKKVGLP